MLELISPESEWHSMPESFYKSTTKKLYNIMSHIFAPVFVVFNFIVIIISVWINWSKGQWLVTAEWLFFVCTLHAGLALSMMEKYQICLQ